jgi:hypothetical protein
MECRDVVKVREGAVLGLSRELTREEGEALRVHLGGCAACRREMEGMELAWALLGEDPDAQPDPGFRARTLALMEEELKARGILPFRPRTGATPMWKTAAMQIAAVLVAGVAGFFVARATSSGQRPDGAGPVVSSKKGETTDRFALVSGRTVDAARVAPDLSQKPRLANVSYRQPDDSSGRMAVSFDVTTRYTVEGRPQDKGIAELLAYMMSGSADTEGARGKAIDLVSQHSREGTPPSPEIVSILVETLKKDRNPGVRKKAAEALAQLPPTVQTRDALVSALKNDDNPAVRILAVEGLAKAATELKDATTIETLREKAGDEKENGYVRGQAAAALKKISI